MLGGITEGSGFSATEIETMTIDKVRFWWNCIMAYRKKVNDLTTG